jgi:hypothetical protein
MFGTESRDEFRFFFFFLILNYILTKMDFLLKNKLYMIFFFFFFFKFSILSVSGLSSNHIQCSVWLLRECEKRRK